MKKIYGILLLACSEFHCLKVLIYMHSGVDLYICSIFSPFKQDDSKEGCIVLLTSTYAPYSVHSNKMIAMKVGYSIGRALAN